MSSTATALLAIVLVLIGIGLWIGADCTITAAVKCCLFPGAFFALAYIFSTDRELTK